MRVVSGRAGCCGCVRAHCRTSVLHSVLIGTRLCWAAWRSSALWSWTATTTRLMSSFPTCRASPQCASTRTRSTTCLFLWRRSGESSPTSSEPSLFLSELQRLCSVLLLPHLFLFLLTAGSSAWWTTRQHPATSTEAVWLSTQTTGELSPDSCTASSNIRICTQCVNVHHIISMSWHRFISCTIQHHDLLLPPLPHDAYMNTIYYMLSVVYSTPIWLTSATTQDVPVLE